MSSPKKAGQNYRWFKDITVKVWTINLWGKNTREEHVAESGGVGLCSQLFQSRSQEGHKFKASLGNSDPISQSKKGDVSVGGDPVGNVLALQTRGPEFDPQNPCLKHSPTTSSSATAASGKRRSRRGAWLMTHIQHHRARKRGLSAPSSYP